MNHAVWQDAYISRSIQKNISQLALTIARFLPVTVLVRKQELKRAKTLMGSEVEYIIADLDDIWLRDSGAVFIRKQSSDKKVTIDFNFNG